MKPGDINEEGKELEQDGDVSWAELRICSNCGVTFPESEGKSYNIGRGNVWLCAECSRSGTKRADDRKYSMVERIRSNKR